MKLSMVTRDDHAFRSMAMYENMGHSDNKNLVDDFMKAALHASLQMSS